MSGAGEKGGARSYDYFLLIFVNALWGGTDVAAKWAMAEMTPGQTAWARFTVALLFFGPALWMRRREIPRTWSGLAPFVALGACGFFLNFVLNYMGLKLAPASHATALRITEAMTIVVLSAVFLREKVGRRAAGGIAAGTLGVMLVLDVDFSDLSLFGKGYRLGDLIILAGIAVESMYTVIGKGVLKRTRPLTATALACFFGWTMLTVTNAGEIADLAAHPPSIKAVLALAYLGLAGTAFGYWVWYRVLARRQSHRVGMTIMVQPVVGVPLAAAFLGEDLSWSFAVGTALIALGVYFVVGSAGASGSGNSE